MRFSTDELEKSLHHASTPNKIPTRVGSYLDDHAIVLKSRRDTGRKAGLKVSRQQLAQLGRLARERGADESIDLNQGLDAFALRRFIKAVSSDPIPKGLGTVVGFLAGCSGGFTVQRVFAKA